MISGFELEMMDFYPFPMLPQILQNQTPVAVLRGWFAA
jgi:hypothetical protein